MPGVSKHTRDLAVPIELAFAAWLLQRQLGVVFLAPMAVVCVSTLCILWLSRFFGGAQKIWNEGIQTRMDVTTSMLGSMKASQYLS